MRVHVFPEHLVLSYKMSTSLFVLLYKQLDRPIRTGVNSDWRVRVHAWPDTSIHLCTQTQGQVYRMILARCILSLAGYGPWETKAFLTARPAHGKLWEHDWRTQRSVCFRIWTHKMNKCEENEKQSYISTLFLRLQRGSAAACCHWQGQLHLFPPEGWNIDCVYSTHSARIPLLALR